MNYTVVVAEDEELLLNNLVHKIEKADPDFHVIGTAQTGVQALDLVEKLSPDVVFTDIRMPVMDGITLLTKIRDQFPFTKFVITIGSSDQAGRLRNRIHTRRCFHVSRTDCSTPQRFHGAELRRGYQSEPDRRYYELQSKLSDQDFLPSIRLYAYQVSHQSPNEPRAEAPYS